MASIITGIICPHRPDINKLAALVDVGGLTTLLVIGILAMLHGNFNIPPAGAGLMIGGGFVGTALLGYKKITHSDPTPHFPSLSKLSR